MSAPQDLRAFLDALRTQRRSDLLEVEREVDPRHETCAIVAKLEDRHRAPAILFRRVRGSAMPLLTGVSGSLGRMALGLGCGLRDLPERWARAVERQLAPVEVSRDAAPVQTHVVTEVDLGVLPALVYHEHDTDRPYLTGGIAAARDPDTGRINLSYHRLMVCEDARSTGILIEPGKHLDRIHARYRALARAMPLGIFFGSPPAWMLGALYSGDADVEEYAVIGGLLEAPLELVRGVTQPEVLVPARAELVLEGFVPPDEEIDEGPFGEFTGVGTGMTRAPVFRVTAMTHRPEPIFQDVVPGHLEHLVLPSLAIEYRTARDARRASPNVTQVALAAPLTAVVALRKTDDGEPRRIIEALLAADVYSKQVIVVDDDVDPRDFRAVLGAMALWTQADRDVVIVTDAQGTPLNPSCADPRGRTAKLGIDATRSLERSRSVTRNTIPRAVWDAIDVEGLLRR